MKRFLNGLMAGVFVAAFIGGSSAIAESSTTEAYQAPSAKKHAVHQHVREKARTHAKAHVKKRIQAQNARRFDRVDRNDDGKIGKREAAAAAKHRFDRIDRNDDGAIGKREARKAHPHGGPHAAKRFDRLDRNDDGKIGKREAAAGAKRRFDRLDANNNGKVGKREIHRAKQHHRRQHGADRQNAGRKTYRSAGQAVRNRARQQAMKHVQSNVKRKARGKPRAAAAKRKRNHAG